MKTFRVIFINKIISLLLLFTAGFLYGNNIPLAVTLHFIVSSVLMALFIAFLAGKQIKKRI